MPDRPAAESPIERVHARLDDLFSEIGDLKGDLASVKSDTGAIKARCVPCQEQIIKHEHSLYGNGKDGVLTRVSSLEGKAATAESGRTDTLSIKGMILLLGAIGTLIGAVAGAIGGTIGALTK